MFLEGIVHIYGCCERNHYKMEYIYRITQENANRIGG